MAQSNIIPENYDPNIKNKNKGCVQRCKDSDLCRKGDCTFSHGTHPVLSDRINKGVKIGVIIGTRDCAAVKQAHEDAMKAQAAKQEAKKANKKVYDSPASTVSEQISRIDPCDSGTACRSKKCALRHVKNPQDAGDLSQINKTPFGMPGLVKVPHTLTGKQDVTDELWLIGTREINFCSQPVQSTPAPTPAPVVQKPPVPKKSYVDAANPTPIAKPSPAPAKATSTDVVIAKTPTPMIQSNTAIQTVYALAQQVSVLAQSIERTNDNLNGVMYRVDQSAQFSACAAGAMFNNSITAAQQVKEMKGLVADARDAIGGFGEQVGDAMKLSVCLALSEPETLKNMTKLAQDAINLK